MKNIGEVGKKTGRFKRNIRKIAIRNIIKNCHLFSWSTGFMKETIKSIIVKYNKLPPKISTIKPRIMLEKYELTIINIHVKVKAIVIKTYKGFLKTPLSPTINLISYPQIKTI